LKVVTKWRQNGVNTHKDAFCNATRVAHTLCKKVINAVVKLALIARIKKNRKTDPVIIFFQVNTKQ
jgi:hypothetical protein